MYPQTGGGGHSLLPQASKTLTNRRTNQQHMHGIQIEMITCIEWTIAGQANKNGESCLESHTHTPLLTFTHNNQKMDSDAC